MSLDERSRRSSAASRVATPPPRASRASGIAARDGSKSNDSKLGGYGASSKAEKGGESEPVLKSTGAIENGVKMKRYFNGGALKTHSRCWSHVVMLMYELYSPRNPVFLTHWVANVLWQFWTVSASIESTFRVVDLSTIMPMLFSVLYEQASANMGLQVLCAGGVVFAMSLFATLFASKYNVITQAIGLGAFAMCFWRVSGELDPVCMQAGLQATMFFLVYAVLFLLHLYGNLHQMPGLGDLTDKVRKQYSGTWTGLLLDFASIYDVGHWFCVAAYFSLATCR